MLWFCKISTIINFDNHFRIAPHSNRYILTHFDIFVSQVLHFWLFTPKMPSKFWGDLPKFWGRSTSPHCLKVSETNFANYVHVEWCKRGPDGSKASPTSSSSFLAAILEFLASNSTILSCITWSFLMLMTFPKLSSCHLQTNPAEILVKYWNPVPIGQIFDSDWIS